MLCDEKRLVQLCGINPKSAWNLQVLRREAKDLLVCPLKIYSFLNRSYSVAKKETKNPIAFCKTFHLVLTKAEFYTLHRIYLFGWTFLLLWSESFSPACVYQMSSRCSQRNRWPVKQQGHTIRTISSAGFACSERVTAESLGIVFSILIKRAEVVWVVKIWFGMK